MLQPCIETPAKSFTGIWVNRKLPHHIERGRKKERLAHTSKKAAGHRFITLVCVSRTQKNSRQKLSAYLISR